MNEDLNGNAADHQDWIDTAPVKCPKDKVVTGVQFYKKGNRSAIKIRCSYPWGGGDEWVLNDADAGFFRSRRSEQNDFIDLHPVTVGADQVISGLQIRQYGNRIAPQLAYYSVAEINRTRNALNSANYELSAAQAELARLNQALNSSDGQRQQWQAELDEINRQLAAVRQRIAELTTSYLELIAKANNTAQTMPDLPDQEDPRGLRVQGALLPFAVSSTRLHALESCTGRVTLTYQDGDGNLRQTHYDAAYDADGKGEEWLPDGYRAALALDGRSPALPLPASVFAGLSNQVTIEFWAKGGSDLPESQRPAGRAGQRRQPPPVHPTAQREGRGRLGSGSEAGQRRHRHSGPTRRCRPLPRALDALGLCQGRQRRRDAHLRGRQALGEERSQGQGWRRSAHPIDERHRPGRAGRIPAPELPTGMGSWLSCAFGMWRWANGRSKPTACSPSAATSRG